MSYYVVTFPTYPDPSIRFVRYTTCERAEADRYLRALRSGAELLTYASREERDAAWPELAPRAEQRWSVTPLRMSMSGA